MSWQNVILDWMINIGVWLLILGVMWYRLYRNNAESVSYLKRNHYLLRDISLCLKEIQIGLSSIATDMEVGVKHRLEDIRLSVDQLSKDEHLESLMSNVNEIPGLEEDVTVVDESLVNQDEKKKNTRKKTKKK